MTMVFSPVEFGQKIAPVGKNLDQSEIHVFLFKISSAFRKRTLSIRVFWAKKVTGQSLRGARTHFCAQNTQKYGKFVVTRNV